MITRRKYIVTENIYNFLTGPGNIWANLTFCFKAIVGFLRGFKTLHLCGPSVCIIGSASNKKAQPYFNKCAEEIGTIIANMGLTTITSGHSALMIAANKGAYNSAGHSVSCNIPLENAADKNVYLHRKINVPYFFVQNILLIKHSYACIVMPGDMDTLSKLFEILHLSQKKAQPFPVIVFGKRYYAPIKKQLEAMHAAGVLPVKESANLYFTNSLDEIEYILQEYVTKYVKTKDKFKRGGF